MALVACSGNNIQSQLGDVDQQGGDELAGDPGPPWVIEQVEEISAGCQVRIAVAPSGEVWVVSWANESYTDGICDEVDSAVKPLRMRLDLRYAHKAHAGSWVTGVVASPPLLGMPMGVSLAIAPNGNPALAFAGGEAHKLACLANDAIYAVWDGSGWKLDTAVVRSDEAFVAGEEASNAGYGVGYWPALAFDAGGNPAIAYRDTHFVVLQHDDTYRSDLELAWRSSGWQHEAIDWGEGAGEFGTMLFDHQDRPVVFYAITIDAHIASRLGVWAARRDHGGSWERVQLHAGVVHKEVSAIRLPGSNDLVAAWYSARDKAVRVRRLSDHARFIEPLAWDSEVVYYPGYDVGQGVCLAVTPSGSLAMSYHRCRLLTSGSTACDQNDEAAVFAMQQGSTWRYQVIRAADVGSCGDFTSLAMAADGVAWVAFRCTVSLAGGEFTQRLFVAHKEIE